MSDSSDDESNNSMDAEMKAKIAAFMDGVEDDDDDEAEEEDDDNSDGDLKDLDTPDDLPANSIDCLVLGTSDLEKGRAAFEEMTGLKTGNLQAMRGGGGTKSVLCRLANNVYIDIMAPDGSRTDGTPGALAKLDEGELVAFHYAVRSPPEAINGMVPDSSWALDKITMVGTGSPLEFKEEDGPYKWDLTYLLGHELGGCVPSFVNWRQNEAHPTCRLEDSGAKIKKVAVRVPEGHKVLGMLENIDGIKIVAGKPKLVFEIDTPEKGKVKFEGKNTMGVVMPGFEDTTHQSYNK